MRVLDLITRAGRSLKNAKARTILTSLAIAVGALTLTITLAAGNGIRAYTDRLISNNFDPAESIVGKDPEIENSGSPNSKPKEYDESIGSVSFGGGDGGSVQYKQITDGDVKELKAFDFVEQVRPNYQINVRYITREGEKNYTVSAQAYNPGQKPELVAGSVPSSGDLTKGEVLLPDAYLSLLGFDSADDAIGMTVSLNAQQPFSQAALQTYFAQLQAGNTAATPDGAAPANKSFSYKIKGVTKKGATSLAIAGLPVLLSDADARELYNYTSQGTQDYGKYLYVYVRVKDGANDEAAEKAKETLKEQGYYVQTSQDMQKTLTQFVDILQILVGVFGVITVIASIFGIVNTMYISVLERTREIGLMKALGMRGKDVSWLFRIEAAWIGFLGGIIGAGVAWLIGTLLNPWITQQLNLGDGNSILIFDFLQILALIIILMLVAIIAGWLPARKAARLDPIEALRTE